MSEIKPPTLPTSTSTVVTNQAPSIPTATAATATVAATADMPIATPSLQPQAASLPQYSVPGPAQGTTKYQQLLALIEEMGKDIRPAYTGNKICAERLKRVLVHARILARECIMEADRDRAKQQS
ncbi:unnamed protein product, partial [Mesorhabditis belari]|uniref:Cyclin-dependent kinase 2-associated protein n=1 Tax=Mesorhabditis belari TaxID=2138241 RepID=A0AAF3F8F8_9BILA